MSRVLLGLSVAVTLMSGCRTPPPPRIQVPVDTRGNDYSTYRHDEQKPLPTQPAEKRGATRASPATAVDQRLTMPMPAPVSQDYLDAYDRVGRPRLMVLLERPEQPHRSFVPGDYDLIERIVRDVLSANGQVAMVPPETVRERLTTQQIRDVVAGRESAVAQAAQALRADVVVAVRVEPPADDQQRFTATARNTHDGKQIATVASTLPSPPPRKQIDFAGRLLGERMVDALAESWDRLADEGAAQPPPADADAPSPTAPRAPEAPKAPAAPKAPVAPRAPEPSAPPAAPEP